MIVILFNYWARVELVSNNDKTIPVFGINSKYFILDIYVVPADLKQ